MRKTSLGLNTSVEIGRHPPEEIGPKKDLRLREEPREVANEVRQKKNQDRDR